MRCLVTGATGFVGSNLVRSLLTDGHEVLATGAPGSTTKYLDDLALEVRLADLLDASTLPSLVNGCDWVFHVAGDTSTWKKLASRRRKVNVEATRLLTEASLEAGVSRFVHTSTIDVHGYNSDGSPLTEQQHGDRSLCGIGYDYADTKTEGEALALSRIREGLDVVVVYPGFMIGPYDHTLQLGSIVREFQAGRTVFAPPGTSSFCDVRAVADGMLSAAVNGRTGEGYNLTGYNRSYADFFARIGELLGAAKKPVRMPASLLRVYAVACEAAASFNNRAPQVDSGLAKYMSAPQASDWSKAAAELGYHPGDTDQAILDAAAWYEEFMPIA